MMVQGGKVSTPEQEILASEMEWNLQNHLFLEIASMIYLSVKIRRIFLVI